MQHLLCLNMAYVFDRHLQCKYLVVVYHVISEIVAICGLLCF